MKVRISVKITPIFILELSQSETRVLVEIIPFVPFAHIANQIKPVMLKFTPLTVRLQIQLVDSLQQNDMSTKSCLYRNLEVKVKHYTSDFTILTFLMEVRTPVKITLIFLLISQTGSNLSC